MPMKSQAMAIITLHKLVAASVDDYRKRFPDWSTTVSSVLKKKKKKRKLNVETVSGASKKMKTNLSVSGSEGEEHDKSDSENDGRCDVSNSDNEEESVNSRSENEEENDSERDSRENSDSDEEEISEKDAEDETDIEEKTENNLESEDENNELLSRNEFINNSEAEIKKPIVKNTAVKSLKRHLEQPNPQPPSKKPTVTKATSQKKSNKVVKKNDEDKEGDKHPLKKSVKPRAVKEKPKVVDPFFMTTTNEEYLTSQAPTVGGDKDSNWKSKSDDYSQTRYNSFSNLHSKNQRGSREDGWNDWKRNKFSNRESQQHPKPFAQCSEKLSSNNNVEPFNIFTNRKERRKALHQPAQEEKVEKLHPSWEAKKKQTSIASFQGKKITFD